MFGFILFNCFMLQNRGKICTHDSFFQPKERKKFNLEDVGKLIQDLMGDFYRPLYLRDERYRNLDADQILAERASRGASRRPSIVSDEGDSVDSVDQGERERPPKRMIQWQI